MRKLIVFTLILALLPVMAFPCGNCCPTKCEPCCKQHTCHQKCQCRLLQLGQYSCRDIGNHVHDEHPLL